MGRIVKLSLHSYCNLSSVWSGPACLSSHQHVPSQSVCRFGLPDTWGQITVGKSPSPRWRRYNSTSQLNVTGRIITIGDRVIFRSCPMPSILFISASVLQGSLSDERLQVIAISEGCWGWG